MLTCLENRFVAADSIPRYGKRDYIFILEGDPRIMMTILKPDLSQRYLQQLDTIWFADAQIQFGSSF